MTHSIITIFLYSYEIFETLAKDGVKSELMIRSADRNDEGSYVCEAENEFGKDEKINKVHVIGELVKTRNKLSNCFLISLL